MTIAYTRLSANQLHNHIDSLADLLCDAVNSGASVSFVAPLPKNDAISYWQKVAAQGDVILLVALDGDSVVGSVQLALSWQPNAPHRAEIQKLLVHSAYRRRGIASQLLKTAEDTAKSEGRWLLFLDTERGSGAQYLYEKEGYTCAGVIPQHSLNGDDEYADTVIFYKLLT